MAKQLWEPKYESSESIENNEHISESSLTPAQMQWRQQKLVVKVST